MNIFQEAHSFSGTFWVGFTLFFYYFTILSVLWIWKGSARSVAFFMLDKVPAPELIAATVESNVQPYAEEHEIPFDDLLLQYIKVNLHHSQAHWKQICNFTNS